MTTPTVVNQGLYWREDHALKAYLSGITVIDRNAQPGGRPVPAYYRLPAGDARLRTFPYLIIDRITAARDPEREMRGHFIQNDPRYGPDGMPTLTNGATSATAPEWPIPISLVYQVSAWTRDEQHRSQLEVALLKKFPLRFGALNMGTSTHAADDNTMRRLDILDGPATDEHTDPGDAQKRVFRVRWTVAIESEIFYTDLTAPTVVQDVDVTVVDKATGTVLQAPSPEPQG